MNILKKHATSPYAKLQVALAEVPYLRFRLTTDESEFASSKNFDVRKVLLREREQKLKDAIGKLRNQRQMLRNNRTRSNFPVVAVVGYTNSGKTSLIKALTGDKRLQPKDRLFATLDVTLHGGILPSSMKVLYVDTVGFISDIPSELIECFIATLEDAVHAVIHYY